MIDQLDKNLYKPVTLVSVGAGYGKSMLVRSWPEKSKIPFAWISLSKEDNDMRDFVRCISTSVSKKFPNALGQIQDKIIGTFGKVNPDFESKKGLTEQKH